MHTRRGPLFSHDWSDGGLPADIHDLPPPTVPLDPGAGGKSIGANALRDADIILATPAAPIAELSRWAADSVISHAILYVGDEQVVAAGGAGVVYRPLREVLHGATMAVVFRYAGLTVPQALQIRDFAGQQIGKPYNHWGIVRQAAFRLDRATWCRHKTGAAYDRCVNWVGRINLGTGANDSFFCSQLVLAAFAAAGVPLTPTPPAWGSRGDPSPGSGETLAELRLSPALGYVGHLKVPV